MNSYIKPFVSNDPHVKHWVGWRRVKDKRMLIASCIAVIATYWIVEWREDRQLKRRHTSIAKDIERERWRAAQLGLDSPSDDGFATKYMQNLPTPPRPIKFLDNIDDDSDNENDYSIIKSNNDSKGPGATK